MEKLKEVVQVLISLLIVKVKKIYVKCFIQILNYHQNVFHVKEKIVIE
ncbi:hypothetical protein Mgra_00007520 [Meloidogyne graminicola]|uniref:Uncharacterized protein n=1 Tax=Meloidogyne graminicola TaxID=189291 RepID=A0A8S9ZIS0_9BILA|nr:hypothetical protein Mgra_00007520 [Meloidogyne graminicola]